MKRYRNHECGVQPLTQYYTLFYTTAGGHEYDCSGRDDVIKS